MESYGACFDLESGKQTARIAGLQAARCKPIFLENPDGTITEATPCGAKVPSTSSSQQPGAGRRSGLRGPVGGDAGSDRTEALTSLSSEVDFLFSQHERLFAMLLLLQLCIDVLYVYVYILRMADGTSVKELRAVYGWHVDAVSGGRVLWAAFAVHAVFTLVYYGIATLALWSRTPVSFRFLADCGMLKITSLVLLAYVDKFNLLLFFLYLVSFIYARFLQGLAVSLLLLPPVRQSSP